MWESEQIKTVVCFEMVACCVGLLVVVEMEVVVPVAFFPSQNEAQNEVKSQKMAQKSQKQNRKKNFIFE